MKKKRDKKVAIHAVTQRYTTPMPLNASANPPEGKANQVCVRAKGGVRWSTKGGDDVEDGLTINTGPNGVCETQADPHDDQIIPVGQGIHIDLVPQNVPAAADLKAFLNNIFGIQANVYFTDVVRSDKVIDYDLIEPRDKQLNMSGGSDLTQEEIVLETNVKDASADINVYFVASFLYHGPNTIGKAVAPSIAYIKNSGSDSREVAANEIGHCLGIAYHADQFPDFNPAFLKGKDAKKRLMYSEIQENPKNVLIKAEWDLLNKND